MSRPVLIIIIRPTLRYATLSFNRINRQRVLLEILCTLPIINTIEREGDGSRETTSGVEILKGRIELSYYNCEWACQEERRRNDAHNYKTARPTLIST
jgi:hypothetical protein